MIIHTITCDNCGKSESYSDYKPIEWYEFDNECGSFCSILCLSEFIQRAIEKRGGIVDPCKHENTIIVIDGASVVCKDCSRYNYDGQWLDYPSSIKMLAWQLWVREKGLAR